MKVIKLIVTVLLVLCVTFFLGFYIFLKTVDLNRFKSQIAGQMSKTIGRDVSMKNVSFDFSIINGITLHISGLSVMDHADFSSSPMLYVDSLHLDVDVLPLVLKRQVLASSIEFNSLTVHLVRNREGRINFQEIGKKTSNKASDVSVEGELESPSLEKEGRKSKDFDFSEMLIRSVRVTDGAFSLTDHMADAPTTIRAGRLTLEISNVSLSAPFPFRMRASLWSELRNIDLNGVAQIDAQNRQVRIDDLKVTTDLADIISTRLYEQVPALVSAGLKGDIKGKLLASVHQMILGEKGLLVLSSEGRLTDGSMQFEDSPVPIEGLNVHFEMTESDVEIKEIKMPLASGEVKINGRMMEYLNEKKFLIDLNAADVQLNELAVQSNLPAKLGGWVDAKVKMSGRGVDSEAIKSALEGEGTASVKNGKVLDVNILKLVLSKISFIPNLSDQIEANLPDKYKEKLRAKDTILEKVEINTKIHQGFVLINKAEIIADGFLVIATGKMDFDQNLTLNADLYIPSDLSQSLVASSSELSYFLDDQKRIHIPFRPYRGKLANFQMYPDVEDLGKEIIRNRGKEELKKIIFKALDLDDPSLEQEKSSEEGQVQERQPSPEEILIDNIFDMIPIFN